MFDPKKNFSMYATRTARLVGMFFVLSAGAVSAAPPWAAPPPSFTNPDRREQLAAAFPEIDGQVRAFLVREKVPGAAWGIVIDGKLVHVGVEGLRDVALQAPVQRDTVFRIASMTKSFTAMAILQLRDAGKLSLDDPVEKHLPELRSLAYPTTDAPRITLRHLLTMSAGFPEDNPWGDQQLAISESQFDDLLREGIAFSNSPGVAYEYSNYGYAILGRVVSRVSGVGYREYVRRQILEPLGMRSTTLEPSEVPSDQLALGYRREDDTWKLEPQLADGAFGSMGGMLTSLEDLSRYVGVFLDAWPARDGTSRVPLSRSSLREMQQLWRARPATVMRETTGALQLTSAGYGYGLRISQTCDFGHVVAHSGGLPGFGSQMRWLPEYGVGLIAFGNRTYTGWGAVGEEVTIIPSDLRIRLRDRLVVVNEDSTTHQVASIVVGPGERVETRFSEAVSLSGFCSLHPSGRITIEVDGTVDG